MNRKQRPMDMDSVLAPVGGVVSGGMYRTGDLFWVANDAAAAGVIVGRILKGHISLPKAAVSVADGDDAYFDEDNGVLTNLNSGTLLKVGKFTEAAASDVSEAFCLFGSEASESRTRDAATATGETVECNADVAVITTKSLTTDEGAEYAIQVDNDKVTADSGVTATLNSYAGTGYAAIRSAKPGAGKVDVVIANLHASADLNAPVTFTLKID